MVVAIIVEPHSSDLLELDITPKLNMFNLLNFVDRVVVDFYKIDHAVDKIDRTSSRSTLSTRLATKSRSRFCRQCARDL